MTPRGLLTTVGATALGLGILVGGSAGMPFARAQESTPSAQAPTQTQQVNDREAQRARAYDDFVAALATQLGDDKAAVDTAIRTALKQQVDAQQAAGALSVEQAAAMKAVIDVTQAPLLGGFGGPEAMHGFEGHGGFEGHEGFEGRGSRGGDDDQDAKMPGGDAQQPAQPGDAQGSDQSAPAPAPAVEVTMF